MLIAQCEAEAMPLLPSDAKIARYGIAILDSTQLSTAKNSCEVSCGNGSDQA